MSVYLIPFFFIMASEVENGVDSHSLFIALMSAQWASLTFTFAALNAPDMKEGQKNANKILNIINSPNEGSYYSPIYEGSNELTPEIARRSIQFHNVWFKYPNSSDKWVLRNLSFKVGAGKSLGITGSSGCGKSTIIQLILRFYEPQKGYITIGGIRINEFTLVSLRQHFGYVQQEPIIFNCSVLNNISYGMPHAKYREVIHAAKDSNSLEFIENIKDRRFSDCQNKSSLDYDSHANDLRYGKLSDGFRAI